MINPFRKSPEIQESPGRVYAPVAGGVRPLSTVNDEVFAKGLLGQGVAIEPNGNAVCAPVSGRIILMAETHHAVGILSPDGLEVLVHIGMDTVELRGRHFKACVRKGDEVRVGQRLIEFDREAIKASGYDVITPVVITNSDDFKTVATVTGISVSQLEQIMEVTRQ